MWPTSMRWVLRCSIPLRLYRPSIAGGVGMSAPEDSEQATKPVQMAQKGMKNGAKMRAQRL